MNAMDQKEKCMKCKHARVVYTNRETGARISFIGCECPPYKGKWVAEIKECPNENENMDIKPCPFCGQNGSLSMIKQDDTLKYGIECNNGLCSCLPKTWFCDTKIEAIELWNNRKG